MPDDNSHRRYLIAVGITTDLPKTGPRIVDSVNRMTRVFTDGFGYERVTLLDIDPASDQIRKSIREFCLKSQLSRNSRAGRARGASARAWPVPGVPVELHSGQAGHPRRFG